MEIVENIGTKELMETFREKETMNGVCTVILKVDNPKLGISQKMFDLDLCGKTFLEWAENSVFDTSVRFADYTFGDDFLPAVKRAADVNSKYTFVLFTDTPLFQHKTFLQIMEYFQMKGLSVLKLTRGYVFETNYLMQIDSLLNPQTQYFEEEDFITCYSLKQYAMIKDIMRNRILTYFMKNGVIFEDAASTFVDADVQIGKDTIVGPFNQIKGKTIVESGVFVGASNTIVDSVICEGAKLNNSCISNSLIGKNVTVNEFTKISNNSRIAEGVVVPSSCVVSGAVVSADDELKSFVFYEGK